MADEIYQANLAFLLNYDDGTSHPEIQYELYRLAFQDKSTVHYDRAIGGDFRSFEQEPGNIGAMIKFVSNMIEAVYLTNQEKDNDPFIIMGFEDITISPADENEGKYNVDIKYRLLSDLRNEGSITL